MTRDELLESNAPDLIAEVFLYSAEEGGRTIPAFHGWGCPLMISKVKPLVGYDAWPLLGDTSLLPGTVSRLGFVFSNKDGIEIMKAAGKFFLFEGRFIGEATIVD